MMLLWLTTEASHRLTLKVAFNKELYLIYYQTDLNQIFFKNDDAHTVIVTFMCAGPHFFSPDNFLLYMDASNKPAIYLRFTALVFLFSFFERLSKRISQMTKVVLLIFNLVGGGQYSLSFSPKIFFLFHLFQVEWKK